MTQQVFICSAPHSGSTLLTLMLGAHSKGFAAGEITQLPKNIALDSACSCGQKISECSLWRPVIGLLCERQCRDLWRVPYTLDLGRINAGNEIDRNQQTRSRILVQRLLYAIETIRLQYNIPLPATLRHSLARGCRNKLQLFAAIRKISGKQLIIDSSKHYLEACHLYKQAPDTTKIIVLVRDGRAVFASGLRNGNSEAGAIADWRTIYVRGIPVFKKHLPSEDWLTVHYEKLVTEPEKTLTGICAFLGIAFEANMLAFAAAEQHVANGNKMRFSKNSNLVLDKRWETELNTQQLGSFERQAGELNRQFSYHD